jgi:hypothetical protein
MAQVPGWPVGVGDFESFLGDVAQQKGHVSTGRSADGFCFDELPVGNWTIPR